ncbi:MAG: DNA ligase [Desulfuromonadales bacterium C00003068]|nr:MAG: DNA ligase [Desulfuromonadales bacterium C00003068]
MHYAIAALKKATLFACLMVAIWSPSIFAHQPMLPKIYSQNQDVVGWWMSEKLDGVRGYWDGEQLWSKNGKIFHPPAQFTQQLPPFPLEGELWGGRGTFERTAATILRQQPHAGWFELKFAIFDVPHGDKSFRERITLAEEWFQQHPSSYAFVIEQIPITSEDHLQQQQQRISQLGGEGLIVRNPNTHYSAGRSGSICKIKPYQDDEAIIIAHLGGQGKNTGYLGSLLVQKADGITFKIGTGFSRSERENPPPIGATITFKYNGLYSSGIPKFPVFLRIRSDHEL